MIHDVTITIIHLTNTIYINTIESSIASEERYDDWGESDDSESTQQKMSQSESKEILTTEEVLKLRGGKL